MSRAALAALKNLHVQAVICAETQVLDSSPCTTSECFLVRGGLRDTNAKGKVQNGVVDPRFFGRFDASSICRPRPPVTPPSSADHVGLSRHGGRLVGFELVAWCWCLGGPSRGAEDASQMN
jgi:hypothetical protein